MTSGRPGLRERKKQATRATLSEIALQLALKRGVDKVRVEDIAAAADVSPRTFNNYFPSKEAAIVGNAHERAQQIRSALLSRPSNEPLEDSLRHAVLAGFPESPDRRWTARIMLLRDAPALLGEQRKADLEVERVLTRAIAERMGIDPRKDLYPSVRAAALVAAVRAAVLFWLDASSKKSTLHRTLEQALGQVLPSSQGRFSR